MADFREECYTTKWFGFIFVAIIVIIFYCILFPIYIFKTLFHIRDKLDTMHIRHKYGFLYNQYDLNAYWWESASILRKLMLASVPVFMHEYSTLQLTVSIVISIFFHLLHSTWHPFELYNANLLQHLTFAGTWLTFFLLLLQENFSDQDYFVTSEYICVATVGFNLFVLASAVLIMIATVRNEVRKLKTRVEVDFTISKSLSGSIKGKLSKLAAGSKAHVKAHHLEAASSKAREEAEKLRGGSSKRWGKLSLMTKLSGGMFFLLFFLPCFHISQNKTLLTIVSFFFFFQFTR